MYYCVTVQVKNLRSSVARAAIACLGDMFIYTGRYMDPVSAIPTVNVNCKIHDVGYNSTCILPTSGFGEGGEGAVAQDRGI